VRDESLAAAQQAIATKDQFMAELRHELRTPLTPVLTTATMLQEDEQLPERYHEDVEMIRRNVELEARLIDDLLDVTRIARGKVALDCRPVELRTVIQHAVQVCTPDLEERHLHLAVNVQGGPYVVEADPARLQQVFWNLLKNAAKFTPQGGCVGVRVNGVDGQVTTEVSDSGVGIEPDVLPRIFRPFDQGEANTTRRFGGLGLGLTISKAMVEMHHGQIEAHSEGRGKGATFTVTLPIHDSHTTTPEPADTVAEPALETSSRQLGILLVEDHADTARIMKRLLTGQGHRVQVAGDVASALQLAEAQDFDLLLSDLGLPDGSGLTLMQELRARGHTLPGIALSGYGQDSDIEQSKEAGFLVHLTKPASPRQLQEAIHAIATPSQRRPADT
jgi:two-component system, chemotaxis family, CheB/CheR fusion protein